MRSGEGCGGGEGRNLGSADHFKKKIHRKIGVEGQICHRDQHVEQALPAKQLKIACKLG